MEFQEQEDIPTLQSIYRVEWSGDDLKDPNYSQSEPDVSAECSESSSSAGSSDEWEDVSEPDEEGEDSDMGNEAGYVHKYECTLICFSFCFLGKKSH